MRYIRLFLDVRLYWEKTGNCFTDTTEQTYHELNFRHVGYRTDKKSIDYLGGTQIKYS